MRSWYQRLLSCFKNMDESWNSHVSFKTRLTLRSILRYSALLILFQLKFKSFTICCLVSKALQYRLFFHVMICLSILTRRKLLFLEIYFRFLFEKLTQFHKTLFYLYLISLYYESISNIIQIERYEHWPKYLSRASNLCTLDPD